MGVKIGGMPESLTCSYCGGVRIVGGVKVGQSAKAGRVGLEYQGTFLFTGTEPL